MNYKARFHPHEVLVDGEWVPGPCLISQGKMRVHEKDSRAPATPTIQVIERMFSLIDVLASREDAVSLKEISEKTGLHPSTTHRILNDLATGRFVDRPEAGSYRLGMRLLELGNLVKGRLNVRDAALAPMRELHKQIQQPVNLSVRQGDEIVYVERAYSERSGMQVVRAIGGRAPLHLTSTGKLFLAADDAQRVRAYATRTGLAGHTKNSITQLPVLERELAKARQYGMARDNEELELGVRCMAAGIYDDQSKLVAGLSISAPGRPAGRRLAGQAAGDRQRDLDGAGAQAADAAAGLSRTEKAASAALTLSVADSTVDLADSVLRRRHRHAE